MELLVENEGLDHLALEIFSYLDHVSLCRSRLACQSWNDLISNNRLWCKSQLLYLADGFDGFDQAKCGFWRFAIDHFLREATTEQLQCFTRQFHKWIRIISDDDHGYQKVFATLKKPEEPVYFCFLEVLESVCKDQKMDLATSLIDIYRQYPISQFSYKQLLYDGLNQGHVSFLDLILPNVNEKDINKKYKGFTPLQVACLPCEDFVDSEVTFRMVSRLLQIDNIKPNIRDTGGRTPLFHAIVNGFERAALALLNKNDIDIHVVDHLGCNVMLVACQSAMMNVVKRLHQMDPNFIYSRDLISGKTALHYVLDFRSKFFRKDSLKLLEFLLEFIDVNVVDNNNATPLHYACRIKSNSFEVCEMLLHQDNIDVNILGNYPGEIEEVTPLHAACKYDKSGATVKLLLSQENIAHDALTSLNKETPKQVAEFYFNETNVALINDFESKLGSKRRRME